MRQEGETDKAWYERILYGIKELNYGLETSMMLVRLLYVSATEYNKGRIKRESVEVIWDLIERMVEGRLDE